MSPGEAARATLLLAVFAVLIVPTATAAGGDTLVAPLPLTLEGDIDADAARGIIAIQADRSGTVPHHLELVFTAASARMTVTNFTRTETDAGPVPATPLDGTSGGQEVFPSDLLDAKFHITELRPDLLFVVHNGALAGAAYRAWPQEGRALLDVSTEPQVLSYTETPDAQLDFELGLPAETFRLAAAAMRYEVRGDFTFFLHGATLSTIMPDRVYTHDTGTWNGERSAEGPLGPVSITRTTTTQYVQVEVTDGVLTLAAAGGRQDLHAAAEALDVHVVGALVAGSAAGSITIGDEVVRATGDRVRAEGDFHLTPTNVLSGSGKHVVFALDGTYTQLAVGDTIYISQPALMVAAATGAAALAVGVAAYLWPTLKSGIGVPLYAKLNKNRVLDQQTRQLIHQKVEVDPGCQVKQVADELEISWTTAAYHLRVLRKMGLVVAKRLGRHEHYFLAGSRAAAGHQVITALQNPTAKALLETILRNPGIIQKDLCELMGIAPSTASGHLTRLRDVGAVREQRDWKTRRYYVGDAVRQLPIHLGPIGAEPAPATAAL